MPKQKVYVMDDDVVDFLEANRKRFVNERNLVHTAIRDFMAKDKAERHEKMMKLLNLPK